MRSGKKIIKLIIWGVIIVIVGVFYINFHFTSHLEKILKKELIARTATATDGFYKLSYDKLSISFFKGELSIEGIRFRPDSAVFHQWSEKDSLPKVYVDAYIGKIEFKGLNLTWHHDYKKLHFASFEIDNPRILAFQPDSTNNTSIEKKQNPSSKTLYELVSPYINILTVNQLNLNNASIQYTIETGQTPMIYALNDVSFHAYNFRLDQFSSKRGKLLYSENFEFNTNEKQTIIKNQDFILNAENIHLNTSDSLILISHIKFTPQEELWKQTGQEPDNSFKASIDTIGITGIQFWRINGLNHLLASAINVKSSDIELTTITQKPVQKKGIALLKPISLYDILSPVLSSINIGEIGIDKANLEYIHIIADKTNSYHVGSFNFLATNCLIDSLSSIKPKPFYSESFSANANNITNILESDNHKIEIQKISIDGKNGNLLLSELSVSPIEKIKGKNTFEGKIDTVSLSNLGYDKDIEIRDISIVHPQLEIYLYANKEDSMKESKKTEIKATMMPQDIFDTFISGVSLRAFRLKNADITLHTTKDKNQNTYTLNDFNLFVDNFLVNESTLKRKKGWFFDYSNIGFSLPVFESVLPGNKYKLACKEINFTTKRGVFRTNDLSFQTIDSTTVDQISFASPLISIHSLTKIPSLPLESIECGKIELLSPLLKFEKKDNFNFILSTDSLSVRSFKADSSILDIGNIDLNTPDMIFQSYRRDSMKKKEKTDLNNISIDPYTILAKISPRILLEGFNFDNAKINVEFKNPKENRIINNLDSTSFMLAGLDIDNTNKKIGLKDMLLSTRNIEIPLDKNCYTLNIGSVDLSTSSLHIGNVHLNPHYPMLEFAKKSPGRQDWFDVTCGDIRLEGIDIPYYLSNKVINVDSVNINNIVLRNFKNKKVPRPPHWMPMVYSGIQKAPVKMQVGLINVSNFEVNYQELERKAKAPGVLIIDKMNGIVRGFTNIVSSPDQFITLNASGRMMQKSYFTGQWKIPVDSLSKYFYLSGEMESFSFADLNSLITPMVGVKVSSGELHNFNFQAKASSEGAHVNMSLPYQDLRLAFIKDHNGEIVDRKLLSDFVNVIIKRNNPSKASHDEKLRTANLSIERNPYHSTFNYFWQILRPAIAASVGVPQKTQNAAMRTIGFFERIKLFFHPQKGKKLAEEEAEANENMILDLK